MAKLDGVIQFTGKLGQTVGAKGQDGRNVLRVRRNTIKNPKTDAQCAQRMICTTAAQAVSQLKQILNNSFEGKSFGAKSLQHARSLYMRMLRTVPSLDGNGMVYLPKGSLKFPVNKYILSQGTLPGIKFAWVPAEENTIEIRTALDAPALPAALETIKPSQLFPSVEVGNQITLVSVHAIENGGLLSGGDIVPTVGYCRFAFKNDNLPALVKVDEYDFNLNTEAIEMTLAEGPWESVRFYAESNDSTDPEAESRFSYGCVGLKVGLNLVGDYMVVPATALIVSDKIGGKRSSTSFVFNPQIETAQTNYRGGLSAAEAMPTYGDNAASLNLPSDYYLQNSLTPETGE